MNVEADKVANYRRCLGPGFGLFSVKDQGGSIPQALSKEISVGHLGPLVGVPQLLSVPQAWDRAGSQVLQGVTMNVLVRAIKSIRFGRMDAHALAVFDTMRREQNCTHVRSTWRGPRAGHLSLLLGRAACRSFHLT